MKPYKIKNDLWFYPVQSQNISDFEGFYFVYPANFNDLQQNVEFDPAAVDESSPFYGIVNSTMFCFGETKANELKNAGFKRVYDAEQFGGDIWRINGYESSFTFAVRANGVQIYLTIGVLEQSFTQDASISWESVAIPTAPYLPVEENGEIVRYCGGNREIVAAKGGKYKVVGGSSFDCDVSSEVYKKVWKEVIEAPPEIPKGLRIYKNIILINGTQIYGKEDSNENTTEIKKEGDLWMLPCKATAKYNAGSFDIKEIFFQYPYKQFSLAEFNSADDTSDSSFINSTFFSENITTCSETPSYMYEKFKFPHCIPTSKRDYTFFGSNIIWTTIYWTIRGQENIRGRIYRTEKVNLYTEYWGETREISLCYYGLMRPNDTKYHTIAAWVDYGGTNNIATTFGSLLVPVSQSQLKGTYFFNCNIGSCAEPNYTPFYAFEVTEEYNDDDGFYGWLFNGVKDKKGVRVYRSLVLANGAKVYKGSMENTGAPTNAFRIYKDIFLMDGVKILNEDGTEYTEYIE